MRLSLGEIAACTGGSFSVEPADRNAVASSLTWDSRTARPGCVYVALPGERVDGHDFAAAAVRAGAVCVLASHELDAEAQQAAREAGAGVVLVADTAAAVTDLARAWRARLKGTVVGITGSTGKTTTKNLVRDVLAAAGTTAATAGNQNNELGVPNTVLAADEDTQFVVVEMGMRGLGQIAALCAFVRPAWGLVTNVGESHIELLGSREGIARAKAELVAALPGEGGMAFLNGADDMTEAVWEAAGAASGVERVCFDGSGAFDPASQPGPAVWAEDVALDAEGRPTFTLAARGFGAAGASRVPCTLALRGAHNVSNACSAAAVGLAAGLSLEACAAALSASQPEAGRQEVLRAAGGFTVVDDAYNANPDSMRASLATFCALDVSGRRIAVLGDMGELGAFAPACHARVGAYAAACPLDLLVCVGDLARGIAQAAQEAGMDPARIACVPAHAEALDYVRPRVAAGDAVLVKASHFMGLHRVAEGLVR